MSEHRRYGDLTDSELVELIRGLPRREPRASLRERVLSAPARPRAAAGLRPVFAVAALVVLLFADWLALRWTTTGAPVGPPRAAVAQAEPASREEVALAKELADFGIPVRIALRDSGRDPDSYFALRSRILKSG
jgi:hypothetical protein